MMESHEASDNRGVSVRVNRSTFLAIRTLASRNGVTQRSYLDRLAKLMEILAERSGGDPVSILETVIGTGEGPKG